MCGIVGIYSFEGPPPHRDLWPDLVNHLCHRGPDEGAWWADGPFFLGHRRLAILDLETGDQPMATPDGALVVVFNGQVYNFRDLRVELEALGHTFRTRSDTEVLLHGYRAWGAELPSRLTGMFAFAIADRRRGELFLARDRFGEKPLFLLRAERYLAFASELRALAALPGRRRAVDVEALGGYLCLNYVPGAKTLLEGVERLAPATWKLLRRESTRGEAYWSPPEGPAETCGSLDAALEAWRPRFDRAVRLALVSDVPVGILLSGGIDSSLVAESAMRQGRLSHAYFLDFEEESYSELAAAREVASRLGLPLETTTLRPDALEDFLRLVEHADDPLGDSSALAVWTVTRLAARRNKVVLGGDGGDELYAGYLTYRASLLHARAVSRFPRLARQWAAAAGAQLPTTEGKVTLSYKLRRFLRGARLPGGQAHFSWNGAWLPDEAAALIRPGPERETVRGALASLAARLGLREPCTLQELQRADIAEYLPNDILVKMDRMSMAHSLETRAPFLEHELAAWALRRPDPQKIGPGGELKVLLRAAAREVFGGKVADRPKQGFSIPIHTWVRGPLADTVRDLLAPASIDRIGLLDPARVEAALDDHFAGRCSYGFELWGLAVLAAWHRVRVQRPPDPPPKLPLVERRFEGPGP